MKVKQIRVAVKKSKKFQTYECEETIDLDKDDLDLDYIKAMAMARCRNMVMRQIKLDKDSTV